MVRGKGLKGLYPILALPIFILCYPVDMAFNIQVNNIAMLVSVLVKI